MKWWYESRISSEYYTCMNYALFCGALLEIDNGSFVCCAATETETATATATTEPANG